MNYPLVPEQQQVYSRERELNFLAMDQTKCADQAKLEGKRPLSTLIKTFWWLLFYMQKVRQRGIVFL